MIKSHTIVAGYKNVTQKHEVTYFRTRQRPRPLRVTKMQSRNADAYFSMRRTINSHANPTNTKGHISAQGNDHLLCGLQKYNP